MWPAGRVFETPELSSTHSIFMVEWLKDPDLKG